MVKNGVPCPKRTMTTLERDTVLINSVDVSEDLANSAPIINRSKQYIDTATFDLMNIDGKYTIGSHNNFWNGQYVDVKNSEIPVQIKYGQLEFEGLLIDIRPVRNQEKIRLTCVDAEKQSRRAPKPGSPLVEVIEK